MRYPHGLACGPRGNAMTFNNDAALYALAFLDERSLATCASVCSRWRHEVTSSNSANSLWEPLAVAWVGRGGVSGARKGRSTHAGAPGLIVGSDDGRVRRPSRGGAGRRVRLTPAGHPR